LDHLKFFYMGNAIDGINQYIAHVEKAIGIKEKPFLKRMYENIIH